MKHLFTFTVLAAFALNCSSSDGGGGKAGSGGTSSGTAGMAGAMPPACAAPLCNGACCADDETCFALRATDAESCGKRCDGGSQCPSSASCCVPLSGSDGGVCVSASASTTCLCTTLQDCASNQSCAPAAPTGKGPVGPYVCVAADGSTYHGCTGGSCKVSTDCCVTDLIGNEFCSPPCKADTDCGSASCQSNPLGSVPGDRCAHWCGAPLP